MTGKELYKTIVDHYHDCKKMLVEGVDCAKYVEKYKDEDDFVLNGYFDKKYLANEEKLMKHGKELYDKYIKTKDAKFKQLRMLYAHGFIGAMWNAESIMAKLYAAIKSKDSKEFCNVMVVREDILDKYFAQIARIDNWLRMNKI